MEGRLKLGLIGLAVLWAALVGYVGVVLQGNATPVDEAKQSPAAEAICGSGPPPKTLTQAELSEANR